MGCVTLDSGHLFDTSVSSYIHFHTGTKLTTRSSWAPSSTPSPQPPAWLAGRHYTGCAEDSRGGADWDHWFSVIKEFLWSSRLPSMSQTPLPTCSLESP